MTNQEVRGQSGTLQARDFDPGEITGALGRILRSETFSRSERSRELLQYVVERDLEGDGDRLKGFAIALDVFDREDSFDPSTDAVVRVQAGRLRDLLDTYYSEEGSNDAIRVSVPRGSYVPAYERMAQEQEQELLTDEPANGRVARLGGFRSAGLLRGRTRRAAKAKSTAATGGNAVSRRVLTVDSRLIWVSLSLVVLLLCGNLWLLAANGLDQGSRAAAPVTLAAMDLEQRNPAPSGYLPSVSMTAGIGDAIKTVLEDAIPRYGSVVYRTDKSSTVDEPLSDFYIRSVPTGLNSLNIQLYHRDSGILIGTDQVPGGLDAAALADHVSRITSRFLPVGGVIYAFLETEGRLNPLTTCLVLASAYFNNQSAERHAAAYRCHETLLEQGIKSALVYANLASLTVEVVTDGYDYPRRVDLKDAIAYGRRAIELAPGSSQAHRSLAWAMQSSGEIDVALAMAREANQLNPYDLSIAASYANTLITKGDFATAVGVMERATEASPVHPTWWDFATFVAAYQEGRHDLVLLSSRNLVGHERSHYCAARLIAADLAGDDVLRAKMLKTLAKRDDRFFDDPRAFYERIMPKRAADRMMSALRDAGLPLQTARDG